MRPVALAKAVSPASLIKPASIPDKVMIQAPDGSASLSEIAGLSVGVVGVVVNLIAFAQAKRHRKEGPSLLIRHNRSQGCTLEVAGLKTENIVDVGNRVGAKLAVLIGWQPQLRKETR